MTGPLQVVLGSISVLFLIVASVMAYRAVRAKREGATQFFRPLMSNDLILGGAIAAGSTGATLAGGAGAGRTPRGRSRCPARARRPKARWCGSARRSVRQTGARRSGRAGCRRA